MQRSIRTSDVPVTRPEEAIAVIEGIGRRGTFVELADGRILFSTGGGRFRTSADGGVTWTESRQAVDPDGQPLGWGEGGLVALADGAIGYAARYRMTDADDGDACIAFFHSEDEGHTWPRPVRVTPPGQHHAQLDGTALRTSSGRLIVPTYTHMRMAFDPEGGKKQAGAYVRDQWIAVGAYDYDPGFSWACAYYSDDEGRTWQGNRNGEIFIWDILSFRVLSRRPHAGGTHERPHRARRHVRQTGAYDCRAGELAVRRSRAHGTERFHQRPRQALPRGVYLIRRIDCGATEAYT